MNVIKIEEIEDLIIEIRGKKVLLDSDVAKIYGVETRDVNKAVKNNLKKFPNDCRHAQNFEVIFVLCRLSSIGAAG